MNCENLLLVAETWSRCRGYQLSTVSLYMGGSGDTLLRLQRGGDLTSRRLAGYMQFFSDNWPDNAEWPSNVERPVMSKRDAA